MVEFGEELNAQPMYVAQGLKKVSLKGVWFLMAWSEKGWLQKFLSKET